MSLRSRIVWAVAMVFAGISLLAGGLVLSRTEARLRQAFDRTVRTRAEWLLALVSTDPVVLPLPTDTERMLVSYRAYGHTKELFRSPGFPNQGRPDQQGRAHSFSYRLITVRTTTDQLPDGEVSLLLSVPDASLHQDINQLRWVFGLSWLLSLSLALAGGYLVAGWLFKPIQRIVDRANDINDALSADSISLPKSHDELYRLVDTLNRMLGRIRESAELQRNFFGAAAHELRTPLAIMKTGLEVTLDRGQVDERTTSFLAGQLDEVNRLTRLLDEFLTLSRPDAGLLLVKPVPTNLTELVATCLRTLASTTNEYDVTICSEPAAEPVTQWVIDVRKLEHVLLNLLENAIKYATPGSQIRIWWEWQETCTVWVQNQTQRETGLTLNLMEPYVQADPFREGHGLGLWISHRLTALLGGQLQLQWQGHTFTSMLTLPITLPTNP